MQEIEKTGRSPVLERQAEAQSREEREAEMENCLKKVIELLRKETQAITKRKDLSVQDINDLNFLIRILHLCKKRLDLKSRED